MTRPEQPNQAQRRAEVNAIMDNDPSYLRYNVNLTTNPLLRVINQEFSERTPQWGELRDQLDRTQVASNPIHVSQRVAIAHMRSVLTELAERYGDRIKLDVLPPGKKRKNYIIREDPGNGKTKIIDKYQGNEVTEFALLAEVDGLPVVFEPVLGAYRSGVSQKAINTATRHSKVNRKFSGLEGFFDGEQEFGYVAVAVSDADRPREGLPNRSEIFEWAGGQIATMPLTAEEFSDEVGIYIDEARASAHERLLEQTGIDLVRTDGTARIAQAIESTLPDWVAIQSALKRNPPDGGTPARSAIAEAYLMVTLQKLIEDDPTIQDHSVGANKSTGRYRFARAKYGGVQAFSRRSLKVAQLDGYVQADVPTAIEIKVQKTTQKQELLHDIKPPRIKKRFHAFTELEGGNRFGYVVVLPSDFRGDDVELNHSLQDFQDQGGTVVTVPVSLEEFERRARLYDERGSIIDPLEQTPRQLRVGEVEARAMVEPVDLIEGEDTFIGGGGDPNPGVQYPVEEPENSLPGEKTKEDKTGLEEL